MKEVRIDKTGLRLVFVKYPFLNIFEYYIVGLGLYMGYIADDILCFLLNYLVFTKKSGFMPIFFEYHYFFKKFYVRMYLALIDK